jgi:uncharacterized protein (DUF1015 family)
MANSVLPVQAFRYDPEVVGNLGDVLAPPYDVISPDDQQALYARHPANVVRLILGRKLPTDTDADNRYTRSRDDLRAFLAGGAIRRDAQPAFYVYDQTFALEDGRTVTRRGVVGRWRIQDEGGLLAHERTLDGPKADRFQLFRACKVVCSQVFTFYSDPERRVDAILAQPGVLQPGTEFACADGVIHRLSLVTRPDAVLRISEVLSGCTQFIADGHHRFETTKKYRTTRREEVGHPTGEEPFNFASVYMANTFQDGLVIQPIYRLLKDVPGFDPVAFLDTIATECDVIPVGRDVREASRLLAQSGEFAPSFALWLADGVWRIIRVRPQSQAAFARTCGLHPTVAALDVSWLHQHVFFDLLGITREAQAAQTNLDYRHTIDDVANALTTNPGQYQAAILLNPVKVGQIQAVAAAGQQMPQKSTFFYPKIISGLVIHPLEDEVP